MGRLPLYFRVIVASIDNPKVLANSNRPAIDRPVYVLPRGNESGEEITVNADLAIDPFRAGESERYESPLRSMGPPLPRQS